MSSCRTLFSLNSFNSVYFGVLFRLTVCFIIINISSSKHVINSEEIHFVRRIPRSYLISTEEIRETSDLFQDLITSFVPQEDILIDKNDLIENKTKIFNGRTFLSEGDIAIRKYRRWLFGQGFREFNHEDYTDNENETNGMAFWESSLTRFTNDTVNSTEEPNTSFSYSFNMITPEPSLLSHKGTIIPPESTLPSQETVNTVPMDLIESQPTSFTEYTDMEDSTEPSIRSYTMDYMDTTWNSSTTTKNHTETPVSGLLTIRINNNMDEQSRELTTTNSTINTFDSSEYLWPSTIESTETTMSRNNNESNTINITNTVSSEPNGISPTTVPMDYLEVTLPSEKPETTSPSVEANNVNATTSMSFTKKEEEETISTDPSEEIITTQSPFEMSDDELNFEFWKSSESKERIRQTQAIKMQQYMNPTVDPCEDFYEFACGRWAYYNKIPADRLLYSTFEILRSNLDVILNDLLALEEHEFSLIRYPGANLILDDKVSKLFYTEPREPENVTFEVINDNYFHGDGDADEIEDNINRFVRSDSSSPSPEEQTEHSPQSVKNDPEDAVLKAKNYFQSCLNEDILERRGGQPLLDLIELLGGWPVLDRTWSSKNFDFIDFMAKLRLFNTDSLMLEFIGLDMKNSKNYIIQFDQTILSLPSKEYYLNKAYKRFLNAYKAFFVEIAVLLGGEKEYVMLSADEMIDFETRLATITSPVEQRNNISDVYRKFSIQELDVMIPELDWLRYLSLVFDREVDPNEMVVLLAFDYIKKMAQLVKTTKRTVLANYLIWRFIRHRVTNLDNRFRLAKQRFYFILYGRQEPPPRWRTCVSVVNSDMGMALGSMFVKKYFDENSKQDNIVISSEIQQAFKELLVNTKWMDTKTKKLAIQKLEAITLRIGYPNFILNAEELNNKYKGLQIDPNKYFENILNILLHETKAEQARLYKPVDKNMWNTYPAIVNAYYSRNKNQIMFPAGILQPPFYHKHFPRSLNYGGIGVVIGHEVTHGFDDKGRLFNSNGNLERWWSESDIEAFHERSECIVKQYGNFYVPEVNMYVNGVLTEGENIADNGGVKQAFKAYMHWLEKYGGVEDETLPGLNYTNTQLFFINFAQIWCGDSRPETMKSKLKTSVHPPGKYRVIGTLSNSEDFAREFSCPIGSRMNPKEKCSVW